MAWHVVTPNGLEWEERERAADEAPRWHAPVTDALALDRSRARMWRYSPGGRGRRHKDLVQEEVFVVLEGRMTAYMGDPPERVDLPAGSVLAVEPGTPLCSCGTRAKPRRGSSPTARRPRPAAASSCPRPRP